MGREWIVIGLVIAALGLTEIGLRVVQDGLSGDVAHMNSTDSLVAALDEAPGMRILMFGNSLLFRGVDPNELDAMLEEELGHEVSIEIVHPDGSGPIHWTYLYRRLVFNPERLPDVMVMAFGPGHLRDTRADRTLLRLAAHHVDNQDIGLLFETDLTDIESRSQFLLGRVSTAFALRERISPRVFDLLIPRYRELAPTLLSSREQGERVTGLSTGPRFTKLDRLLDDAEANAVPMIALPMPAPERYAVDEGARVSLDRRGIPILPVWAEAELGPERFPDLEHLDPEGRSIFTALLAPSLAAALRDLPPR